MCWRPATLQVQLIYTAPQEYLFTQIKLAVFGGRFFRSR